MQMKTLRLAWVFAALILSCIQPAPTAAASCTLTTCATAHDIIPNFAGQPTIRSIQSGPWSSAATWNLGRLPNAADIVAIGGGTMVTYDSAAGSAKILGIEANGRLSFRTDIPTRLTVSTLLVLPQGALQVGSAAAPIAANVSAEIIFANE
jgi:hypothetical protein